MLSRGHVIHRSAGEERHGAVRPPGASGAADVALKTRLWAKLVLLAAVVGLFAAFVLLNRGSVVEPRVHLVFARYERPSLLVVMLLTAAFGAAAALVLRAAFATVRQLRDVQSRPSVAASPAGAVAAASDLSPSTL